MASSLSPCTSPVLYTFHPYSKIPQLKTFQATFGEFGSPEKYSHCFFDPIHYKNHGVVFGVNFELLLLHYRPHPVNLLLTFYAVRRKSFPPNMLLLLNGPYDEYISGKAAEEVLIARCCHLYITYQHIRTDFGLY